MSERLLEAFREDAERITRLPAFELIEAAGRARRRRRHALGGVVAACLLAITGTVALQDRGSPDPQPADDSNPRSLVTPFPTYDMTTLAEGTYELTPSPDPDRPVVRLAVPPGWNAWMGPNRFQGLGTRVTFGPAANESILSDDPDWYVGLLVLDVDLMTQRDCEATRVDDRSTTELARALTRIPDMEVIAAPEGTVRFGHRAAHVRLREVATKVDCGWFFRTPSGQTGEGEKGTTYDAWVIDAEGGPLLVWAEWTKLAPRSEVDALLGMVDSIEIHDRE